MNKDQGAVDGSRFCQISDADSIQPQSEEPAVVRWRASITDELVTHLLSLVGAPQRRSTIIAIDERGGSGRTTLTTALTVAVPDTQAFHLDSLI